VSRVIKRAQRHAGGLREPQGALQELRARLPVHGAENVDSDNGDDADEDEAEKDEEQDEENDEDEEDEEVIEVDDDSSDDSIDNFRSSNLKVPTLSYQQQAKALCI